MRKWKLEEGKRRQGRPKLGNIIVVIGYATHSLRSQSSEDVYYS